MKLIFEQIRVGGDRNLAYLVGDRETGVAVAVDPSYAPKRVADRAAAQGLRITHVLNTHGHVDHVNGNAKLQRLTGARLGAHESAATRPDDRLCDGDTLTIGAFALEVLHVPGHAPDHLVFHLPAAKAALTGDHLFVGKIGGTGTEAEARQEYESLARTLDALPDDTTIWPGHDYGCRPSSTIGLERKTNPFLQAADLSAFLELKRTWAAFKSRHGLV